MQDGRRLRNLQDRYRIITHLRVIPELRLVVEHVEVGVAVFGRVQICRVDHLAEKQIIDVIEVNLVNCDEKILICEICIHVTVILHPLHIFHL